MTCALVPIVNYTVHTKFPSTEHLTLSWYNSTIDLTIVFQVEYEYSYYTMIELTRASISVTKRLVVTGGSHRVKCNGRDMRERRLCPQEGDCSREYAANAT